MTIAAAGKRIVASAINGATLDTWTSYVPTWTSTGSAPAIGNGTLDGSYAQAGKFVFFKLKITLGSTSTVGTGNYLFSLPVAAAAANEESFAAVANHASARSPGLAYTNSTTQLAVIRADGTAGLWSATAPFVPANGDYYQISGFYEAA